MPQGEYTLRYTYGDTRDTTNVPFALKYNGYDYIATKIEGQYDITKQIEIEEIKRSGQGLLQFILALDYSYSALETDVVLSNGVTKKRIDVEIEATRKLISALLSSGNNIYIGLVIFSGEAARVASLSRDEVFLNEVLDSLQRREALCYANTTLVGALRKAEESFYYNGPDANRAIVFISDGIPTKDDYRQIYSTDIDDFGEDYVLSVLEQIKNETIQKIKSTISNNIQLMCLLVETETEGEKQWVEEMYSQIEGLRHFTKKDGDELAKSIILDVQDWIEELTKISIDESKSCIVRGLEDVERRIAVDSNFVEIHEITGSIGNKYKLDNGKMINIEDAPSDNIIEGGVRKWFYNTDSKDFYYANINPDNIKDISTDNIASQLNTLEIINDITDPNIDVSNYLAQNQELVRELGERLYMTVQCGTFHIDSENLPSLPLTYDYDGTSYELKSTDSDTNTYIKGTYVKYELETNSETGETYKVYDENYTLTLTYLKTTHENVNLGLKRRSDFDLKPTITATNMKITLSTGQVLSYRKEDMGSEKMLYECIDSQIAQGAEVEVEYQIQVKNDSSYSCHYLELLAALPVELIYSDNAKLLTEPNVSNSDYGWTKTTCGELKDNGKISEGCSETYNNRTIVTLAKNVSLGSSAPYNAKIVLSRFLSSEDIISFENQASVEILGYTNTGFRREIELKKGGDDKSKALGVFPGNTYVDTNKNLHSEIDYAECTNKIAIVPPTGLSSNTKSIKSIYQFMNIILCDIKSVLKK